MDHVSLRDQHLEDSSSDDGERLGSQGRLMFEYLERDLPYIREPLADKVCVLVSLLEPCIAYKNYEGMLNSKINSIGFSETYNFDRRWSSSYLLFYA